MKVVLSAFGLLFALALIVWPGYSYGEVRISLKNGADIIADECRGEARSLICYKMGGTFEIDKRDVVSMKNTGERRSPASESFGSESPAPGKSDSSVTTGDKADAVPPAGKTHDSAAPGNSSDPLAQKRLSLQAEREDLLKERQQIQEAIKHAPDWMSEKQFNELNRRNAELDARIKKFNEEAGRLSEQGKQPGADVNK